MRHNSPVFVALVIFISVIIYAIAVIDGKVAP